MEGTEQCVSGAADTFQEFKSVRLGNLTLIQITLWAINPFGVVFFCFYYWDLLFFLSVESHGLP